MDEILDIASVLLHYKFDLPSTEGGWRTVKCEFHEDSRGSGRVSFSAGAYGCQACPAKGNAITLIAWKEGISNAEAWEKYCEIVGGRPPERRAEPEPVTRRRPFERGSSPIRRGRKPFSD